MYVQRMPRNALLPLLSYWQTWNVFWIYHLLDV